MSMPKKIDSIFEIVIQLHGKDAKNIYLFEQMFQPSVYRGVEIAIESPVPTTPVFAERTQGGAHYFTMFQWCRPGLHYDDILREFFEIQCTAEEVRYATPSHVYVPLTKDSLMHTPYWEINTIFYITRDLLLYR